jgi:hypothetical protein
MTQIDTKNKDVLLATAIAAGATATAAAQQLDVSLSTVQRRMAEAPFRRLVADLRAEMVASALGRMTDKLTRGADTVAELLDAPEPLVRLRAARLLFLTSMRLRDVVDVDERIHELEAEVARRQGATP